MKLNLKTILTIILILLLGFGAFKLGQYLNNKEVEDLRVELREERIKTDTLQKIKDGYYRKLVADTLTKKELREKADSLELELENPRIVEVVKFVPRTVEKVIDSIVIKDTTITLVDYYPQRENYFTKYESEINTQTGVGNSRFSFTPVSLNLGIGQNEDGTYEVRTQLPEFIDIESIDVQSEPITPQEKDNFGWIFGAGYGHNFSLDQPYLNVQAGARLGKTYITLNGGSNNTLSGTLSFEF